MHVNQRSEDQEARAQVVVKRIAHNPRASHEEAYAADHEYCQVAHRPPSAAGVASLASGIVAGNPEILCRVHYRQHSAAVTGLRSLRLAEPGDKRRKREPEKLACEDDPRR